MKKILYIICLCMCSLSLSAQSVRDIDTSQLPKGVTLDGDSIHINLPTFLSVPEQKAALLKAMNQRNAERGISAQITDVTLGRTEKPAATASQSKGSKLTAEPVTATAGISTYAMYDYHYTSVDTDNQPITLSGRMYIPNSLQLSYTLSTDYSWLSFIITGAQEIMNRIVKDISASLSTPQIKWGLLNVHPTVTSTSESPTGGTSSDAAVSYMTTERALVVCPDYLGYGYTKDKQHPYLVQDITARNCIDGYLAAIEIAQDKVDTWSDSFFTTIIGYSQGGSAALACAKYIESGRLTQKQDSIINLRETYCGDGPYSPEATLNQYLYWANKSDETYTHLAYPCVLPLIVQAAKQYYDKGPMRTVEVKDYFTDEFLATGILDDLESKIITTTEMNEKTKRAGIYTIEQMMSDKFLVRDENADTLRYNTTSNEYKCLMRALDKANLTKGWTPEKPVYFFHYDNDLVVPYANVVPIQEKIASGEWANAHFLDAGKGYGSLNMAWLVALLFNQGFSFDDISDWDHVKVGTLFYVWFMCGCPYDNENSWREIIE